MTPDPTTTAAPTESPVPTSTGYVYILTNVNSGLAYGCTSVSYLDIATQWVTVCAGDKTIVSTVSSLYKPEPTQIPCTL